MIAYIIYEYMQIFARIWQIQVKNTSLSDFFRSFFQVFSENPSGSWPSSGFCWSTGDEMISWAQFVTRPGFPVEIWDFPSKRSLSAEKALGFLVLVNLSSLPSLRFFVQGRNHRPKPPGPEEVTMESIRTSVHTKQHMHLGCRDGAVLMVTPKPRGSLGGPPEDHLTTTESIENHGA